MTEMEAVQRRIAATFYTIFVLLVGVLSFACGSDSAPAPVAPTPIVPLSLVVTGNSTFTDPNQTSQLAATVTLSNNAVQDQTRAVSWTSSNTAVASVNTTGFLTSIGSGTATISATFQSVTGTKAASVTLSCQVNNTASVTFGNRSGVATQDILWDGFKVATLTPGQTSSPVVSAAGVAHTLVFRDRKYPELGLRYVLPRADSVFNTALLLRVPLTAVHPVLV